MKNLALWFRRLLLLGPFGILAIAYAGVCSLAGTTWPWTSIVHEEGTRTLLATVFYFEHAVRELPLDILLALACAGSARQYFPLAVATEEGANRVSRLRSTMAVFFLLVLLGVLVGALISSGPRELLQNLAQLHTRTSSPLVWGSHWRYHLLERLSQILLAYATVGVLWLIEGRPQIGSERKGSSLFAYSLGTFGILTIIFRPSWESFSNPVFLGHQARELLTHVLVTLPLSVGACLWVGKGFAGPRQVDSGSVGKGWLVAAGLASTCLGLFLAIGSLSAKAHTLGQTTSLAGLLFPHFFEHSFGYLLVPSAAVVFYLGMHFRQDPDPDVWISWAAKSNC